MKEVLRVILSLVCGLFSSMLGGFDPLAIFLLYMMGIDIFLGLLKALVLKEIQSNLFLNGIVKKISVLLVVYVTILIDTTFLNGFALRDTAIMFFIAGEGISFVENIGQVIVLPSWLTNIFSDLREKGDKIE